VPGFRGGECVALTGLRIEVEDEGGTCVCGSAHVLAARGCSYEAPLPRRLCRRGERGRRDYEIKCTRIADSSRCALATTRTWSILRPSLKSRSE
jgi:hypothetical protein